MRRVTGCRTYPKVFCAGACGAGDGSLHACGDEEQKDTADSPAREPSVVPSETSCKALAEGRIPCRKEQTRGAGQVRQACLYAAPFRCGPRIATDAQVAQLVEQRIENPRVAGSIPALGTIHFNSSKPCCRRCGPYPFVPGRDFGRPGTLSKTSRVHMTLVSAKQGLAILEPGWGTQVSPLPNMTVGFGAGDSE